MAEIRHCPIGPSVRLVPHLPYLSQEIYVETVPIRKRERERDLFICIQSFQDIFIAVKTNTMTFTY